jgi:Family of unknown function (DUF5681)
MPSDKERDYKVGYGKPPCRTRFQKGQSGNPQGRPSGAKNLANLLSAALNERVIIDENGVRRKLPKGHAFIKRLVDRAVAGDWRAAKILLDHYPHIDRGVEAGCSRVTPFTDADRKVIEGLKDQLRDLKEDADE